MKSVSVCGEYKAWSLEYSEIDEELWSSDQITKIRPQAIQTSKSMQDAQLMWSNQMIKIELKILVWANFSLIKLIALVQRTTLLCWWMVQNSFTTHLTLFPTYLLTLNISNLFKKRNEIICSVEHKNTKQNFLATKEKVKKLNAICRCY